jgi:hypothetical protein
MSGTDTAQDGGSPADAGFAPVRAVADAILYEGYILYPYRKSSPKNRVRWQFGILAPRDWVERDGPVAPSVAGSVESWQQQTECLFEVPDTDAATVEVRVRYLQCQAKTVQRRDEDGRYRSVEEWHHGGQRYLSFDEAVAHEQRIVAAVSDLLERERTVPIGVAGGEDVDDLGDGSLRVLRHRWPLAATATLRAERLPGGTGYRLRVRIENAVRGIAAQTPRESALRHCLIATHTLLGGRDLRFLSLIEPPDWAVPHVAACRNVHTFPVLAGDIGARDRMLSSPILLYDHPQVAPESPGDLHDAAEIDEILSLRTLTLTDEEKREARATDPRAAAIVDRVEDMPDEVLARLHGAIRSLRPQRDPRASSTAGHVEGGR